MSNKETEKSDKNLPDTMKETKPSVFATIEKSILDIDIVNDREKALEFFKVMSKSKITPDKTPEELMALYLKSRELGIGFASAADHMHIVKGRAGVDIHIVRALLLKAGSNIWWEKIKDYEPQYKYTDGNNVWVKSESANPDDFLPRECLYVYDKKTKDKARAESLIPVWKDVTNGLTPVDWITTYKFYREVRTNKDIRIITEIGTFSWSEALRAKLPMDKDGQLNPNSNWQKYRKLMIDHRAFTFGARAIGADLLLGLYETKELLDANNISYTVNEEAVIVK